MYKECSLCKCKFEDSIKYFPLDATREVRGSLCMMCTKMVKRIERKDSPKIYGVTKRPWTTLEEEYLISNYGLMPTTEIAEALDRTVRAVYRRVELIENRRSL